MSSSVVADVSYPDLYARWERGNWAATEIDFSEDRRQWHEEMDDRQRRAALWNYSLFFHGEHAVAETLGPFIDAAPEPEQKYFLTTQQVDETRHSVLFARFMSDVVGAGSDVRGSLASTRPHLTWGFRELFGRLDRMAAELRKDPTLPRLAGGVTLYHILIEASLAQPGQHFIEGYLEDSGMLPGFLEGMRRVSFDEQRHIGFGVRLLHDLVERDPACRDAVSATIREAMRWVPSVFVPPGWDESYATVFGFTLEDVYAAAAESLEQKLRAAGLPPEELNGALPYSMESTPRERAAGLLTMLKARLIGEKTGPPEHDPEAVALFFDAVRMSIDHRQAPRRRSTILWDFTDHEPWHLVVHNGSAEVGPGRADADLTFHCRFEDFIDVSVGREDPTMAIVKRRMRPRGSVRLLMRMQ